MGAASSAGEAVVVAGAPASPAEQPHDGATAQALHVLAGVAAVAAALLVAAAEAVQQTLVAVPLVAAAVAARVAGRAAAASRSRTAAGGSGRTFASRSSTGGGSTSRGTARRSRTAATAVATAVAATTLVAAAAEQRGYANRRTDRHSSGGTCDGSTWVGSTIRKPEHRTTEPHSTTEPHTTEPRSTLGAAQHEFAWQPVSQPLSQPQDGWHEGWQQLLQPQSFRPIMRSRSSKPKLWLHRPTLTTSAPKTMFHFIEQRLLYLNCG